jgi:hypothetical protein
MTNKEVYDDLKPEGPRQVGRMNNESEHVTDQGTASLQEEIGVVNNEAPGGVLPAEPEIGRTNNERSETEQSPNPEIGMINNEQADAEKLPEPLIDMLKSEPPIEHSSVQS